MILSSPHQVRLTRAELNGLRQTAARNGRVVNRVETPAELLRATLDALPAERLADLLEFLETGSSPPHARSVRAPGALKISVSAV